MNSEETGFSPIDEIIFPVKPSGLGWHLTRNPMIHVDYPPTMAPFHVTTPSADESTLVARAQGRDIPAFEDLYHVHLPRIYALCWRMTANPRRAEELTQKSFLAVWNKLPAFRGECSFATWLHRIAVNTVLGDFRSEQRRTQRIIFTDDLVPFEVATVPVAAGTRLDLEEAIARLPPQARIVFILHDVEGWRHDEIATNLGIATGTSKAQLHRARQLLQKDLS